jgi:thiamine monophosphate kinase
MFNNSVSARITHSVGLLLQSRQRVGSSVCVDGSLGARTAALLLAFCLLCSKMLVFFLVPRPRLSNCLGNIGFLGRASILFANILEAANGKG